MLFSSINNTFRLKALWIFMRNYFLKLAIIDGHQDFMFLISHTEGSNYKCFNFMDLQTGQAH